MNEKKLLLKEVKYIEEQNFKDYLLRREFIRSESLSIEYSSEIFTSNSGEVLDQCIYGPSALKFNSLDFYKYFRSNFTFALIKSNNSIVFIEIIDSEKYNKLVNSSRLKLNKVISDKIDANLYFDDEGKVYSLDSTYNSGTAYLSLVDFFLVRKEYGFDDDELILAFGISL